MPKLTVQYCIWQPDQQTKEVVERISGYVERLLKELKDEEQGE